MQSAALASDRFADAVRGVWKGEWGGLIAFAQSLLIPAASAVLVVIVAYFVAKYVSRIASAPVRKRVDETWGVSSANSFLTSSSLERVSVSSEHSA